MSGLRESASESAVNPTPDFNDNVSETTAKPTQNNSELPTPFECSRQSPQSALGSPSPLRNCWDLESPSEAAVSNKSPNRQNPAVHKGPAAQDEVERPCMEAFCFEMAEFFDDCFGFELVDNDVNEYSHAKVVRKTGKPLPRDRLEQKLRKRGPNQNQVANTGGYACSECGYIFQRRAMKFCPMCGTARDTIELARIEEKKKVYDADCEKRKKHQPYFTIFWPTLVLLMWFVGAIVESGKEENKDLDWYSLQAGLDTIFPGETLLQVHSQCKDLRLSFWLYRMYLYQFTHIGIVHALSNCVIVWVLGIRLERLHGTLRMALFFNIGVIGGACCYYVSDAHNMVAGMSGGVYAVQGMHWGYLALNWCEKRHPWLWMLMLAGWVVFDVLNYFALVDDDGHKASTSNSAHIGGAVAGCLIAVMWGENLVEKWWEKYRWWIAGTLIFVLWCFCFSFNTLSWPPKTVFDPTPWCWKKLIYNTTYFGDMNWHCVRCGNDEGSNCISTWEKQTWKADVSLDQCHSNYGGWSYTEKT